MLKLRAGCQEIQLSRRVGQQAQQALLPVLSNLSSKTLLPLLNSCLTDSFAMSGMRQLLDEGHFSESVSALTDHQVVDRVSSLVDTGAIACQVGTSPDGCCCCVESLDLSDFWWQPWETEGYHMVGHFFRPVVKLKYAGAGSHRSCTLEWWEKTNLPYNLVLQPNTWTRITDKKAGSIEKWVQQVKEPCPGAETIQLFDPPSLAEGGNRTVTRVLEFRIVVNSGTGCTCGNGKLLGTARQTLVMEKGKVIQAKSKFEVPNTSRLTAVTLFAQRGMPGRPTGTALLTFSRWGCLLNCNNPDSGVRLA